MQSRGARYLFAGARALGLDVSKRENLQECVYSTNYVASQPPGQKQIFTLDADTILFFQCGLLGG
jgi:hypothetical protein